MLSFYRPDFCLFRLQICTSWSSPITSATASTFVLVCPIGPYFQTSAFACNNICPFGLQLLQRLLLLQLSPLTLQCFCFIQLLALSTFASAFFPFRRFVLSPLTLHLSRDSLSVRLIRLHISFVQVSFLISCSFLLVQFNSAVSKIQTSRSMFQQLPWSNSPVPWSNSPVVVLRSMLEAV